MSLRCALIGEGTRRTLCRKIAADVGCIPTSLELEEAAHDHPASRNGHEASLRTSRALAVSFNVLATATGPCWTSSDNSSAPPSEAGVVTRSKPQGMHSLLHASPGCQGHPALLEQAKSQTTPSKVRYTVRYMDLQREHRRAVGVAATIGAAVASLCCAGPLLIAVLGILSIPTAGALSLRLFYGYWWAFVSAGVLTAAVALVIYFRRRGVCTLHDVNRRRREIMSAALATLTLLVAVYLIWDYVIVEYLGVRLGLWQNPFSR